VKKKAVLALPFLLMSAALQDYHPTGLSENHPDAKIFRWAENHAGDCHQVGAVLVIRPNGTATFDANVSFENVET
jgi:hypothetical protein